MLAAFALAFLLPGTICIVAQVIAEFIRPFDPPTFALAAVVVGALLVPLGVADGINAISLPGISASVPTVGISICQHTILFLETGVWQPYVFMFCVFIFMAILAIVTGLICVKAKKPKKDDSAAE